MAPNRLHPSPIRGCLMTKIANIWIIPNYKLKEKKNSFKWNGFEETWKEMAFRNLKNKI